MNKLLQYNTIKTQEPWNTHENMDAFLLHKSSIIGCFTYSYYCGNSILLKFLNKTYIKKKWSHYCSPSVIWSSLQLVLQVNRKSHLFIREGKFVLSDNTRLASKGRECYTSYIFNKFSGSPLCNEGWSTNKGEWKQFRNKNKYTEPKESLITILIITLLAFKKYIDGEFLLWRSRNESD